MSVKCSSCTRPVADQAYLCAFCSALLLRRLEEIPALADDLEVTRTRQSKTGGQGVGFVSGTTSRPLPWNDTASLVVDELRVAVVGVVRVVEETQDQCASNTLSGMATYLRRHRETIRHHQAADELLGELDHACQRGWSVIDRPADKVYVGLCTEKDEDGTECPEPLYAKQGASRIVCRRCKADHDVEARQRFLRLASEATLLTATEMSRAVSSLGREVHAGTVRQWAARRKLFSDCSDEAGSPLYRVGDVLDLIAGSGRMSA